MQIFGFRNETVATGFHGNLIAASGRVLEVHPHGRDRVLLPYPVIEVSAVVGDLDVIAVFARRDVAAERCCPAALDGRHHLELAEAGMTGLSLAPGGTVVAEDVRDLQRRPGLGTGGQAGGADLLAINGVRRSSGLMTDRMVLVATWAPPNDS